MLITTSQQVLDELAQQLPGLELGEVALALAASKDEPPPGEAEGVLHIKALGKTCKLRAVPVLRPARRDIEWLGADKQVLLVAPHLPDKLAAECRQRGLCHADLNGRLYLKTPFLLIDREPKRADFRNPVSETNVFAAKASRVARWLLAAPGYPLEQFELEAGTGLSRGLISRILQALVREGYVTKLHVDRPVFRARYKVRDFDRFLDDWASADDWHRRVTIHRYSVLENDPRAIATQVRDTFGETAVFTQWFAASLRHPYTTPPVVSAYVRDTRQLASFPERPVDSGGNLWLIVPRDPGVFQDFRTVEDFRLVADVQIYLDLLQVGQRGPDQAQALRQWEGFCK